MCVELAHVEIIIVDDGSTDSTSDICDDYGNRFDNVSVFHQPNSGPGIARNCGLDHARGSIFGFWTVMIIWWTMPSV